MSKRGPLNDFMLSLTFGSIGIGLTIWSTNLICLGVASESFHSVQGNISKSVLSIQGHGTYWANVMYHYTVAGRPYKGTTISAAYFYRSPDSSEAQSLLRKYKCGDAVTVYYNPADPRQAVLERGVGFSNFIFLAITSTLAVVGIGLLPVIVRRAAKQVPGGGNVPVVVRRFGKLS